MRQSTQRSPRAQRTAHTHTTRPLMRAPRATKAQRAYRLTTITKRVSSLLDILSVLDSIDELDALEKKRRSSLVPRERRPFAEYIKPMLQDHTFSMRFRMDYDDFMVLVDRLRPALTKDEGVGRLRNGAVPVEYQVAMTLRWLAGGSIYECMDGHVIARSTAYAITSHVVRALTACPELNCKWPEDEDVTRAAGLFRNRSSFGVIRKCVGAIDGLFVRLTRPSAAETAEPNSYYSGHKKGFGMNFQVRVVVWHICCLLPFVGEVHLLRVGLAVALCTLLNRSLLLFPSTAEVNQRLTV